MTPAAIAIIIGLTLTSCAGLRTPPPSTSPLTNPIEQLFSAYLYMQTAAEYDAVCIQTYNWAAERLRSKLAALPKEGPPPAVIMDLDETVMDNGGYESFLIREGVGDSPALWDVWERDFASEVAVVLGAKAFIEAAEQMGVTVVYITNRMMKYRDETVAALQSMGLSVEGIDRRLFLKESTTDKTERRKKAEAMYRVVLWIGDGLRDFTQDFAAPTRYASDAERRRAIAERKEKVLRAASRFGDDWIILPNPMYGDWLKPLGPDPRKFLRPTGMKK